MSPTQNSRGAVRFSMLALLATRLLVWLPAALAQPVPVGPEFQVNTHTTYAQRQPAVAVGGDGRFVVVWGGYGGGPDPDNGVWGQRYDAAGTPLGGEFQVNTYTTGTQYAPAVAADSTGNFVVVWESNGSAGLDTSGYSIQGQRYDSNGMAQGGEFQVNTYTAGYQRGPGVARAAGGNFVVIWTSNGSAGSDTSDRSIQGQRYDAAGAPQGGQFQVNTYTTGYQGAASVAAGGTGSFVVAWQSYGSAQTDTSYGSIQARRYDSGGTAQGPEFQVNTYTTDRQYMTDVAVDSAGNFVVVWARETVAGGGPDSRIQAQRYDSAGGLLGGEFQVNTHTTDAQRYPVVTTGTAGSFVVAWQDSGSIGTDAYDSLEARFFDGGGTPLGAEVQVNTYTLNSQTSPAVAGDGTGRFVVVWMSYGSAGSDASSASIQGQRFAEVTSSTSTTSSTSSTSTTLPGDTVTETVGPGGTVTTDNEADGCTSTDPLEVSVTTPTGGTVTITRMPATGPPPTDFTILGQQVDITAPAASATSPLTIMFCVDKSLIPAGASSAARPFRNGMLLPYCRGRVASPDPCVLTRSFLPSGDVRIYVLTSAASLWELGVAPTNCASTPSGACVAAGRGLLLIKEQTAASERLKVLLKGLVPAVTPEQFGDPVAGTTSYSICLYDQSDTLVSTVEVARAGESCGSQPCWKAVASGGFRYGDAATAADGIQKIVVKSGDAGKAKVLVKGKNNANGQTALMTGIAALFQANAQATVQMMTSDAGCFGMTLGNVRRADGTVFKALGP